MAQLIATNQLTLTNVNDGIGHLKTWNFYKLSNSTTPPQVVPIGASTNLSQLGPNNTWSPYVVLNGGSSGWNVIDFDKIAKSDIIPDRPFTWYLEASFDGVSNFNGSTDFNIKFGNWYVNSEGSNVYNPLGTRDFTASKFSDTNDTAVNNYFGQSITWTVPRAVYDVIPDGGFLNLRIRIDRFTKLSYHAKNSYVTYGTVPSDPTQRGLGNYSTYGWKVSPETVTQALSYLWIYQVQLYDSGREVANPPTLIGAQGPQGLQGLQGLKGDQGIPGAKGADGKTQYTHIAYADNATGGGFSQTDQTKAYIGMYQDFNATDSTDPTKYKWSKWQGDKGETGAQGVPGAKGTDGRTPYIHFAYSDNADGTGLTFTDNGQRYIGHYSDYTSADSTDKTKYKWADRWAKIDSGGRNYFKYSRSRTYTINSNTTQDYRTFIYDEFWKNNKRFIKSMVRISLDVAFSPALPNDISTYVHFSASPWYGASITFKGGTTERQHFDLVYDLSGASSSYKTDNVFIRFNNSFPLNTIVSIYNTNLYISSVREDYRPAVEELEDALNSKADQALTLEQLNALNEKNQILEAELQAKASIDTFTEFEKAYQSFVSSNAENQAKSEADLVEAGRRIDMLVTQFGGLAELKTFIDTYMSSSNEGLIIGKNDASSTIKVSSDRISMFSAGREVMYISQGVINIDNGIFTASVQIGRFRTEQYRLNADINVVRYVG